MPERQEQHRRGVGVRGGHAGKAFSAPGPYCMQNAASVLPFFTRAYPSAIPTPTRSWRQSTGRISALAAASMSGVVG